MDRLVEILEAFERSYQNRVVEYDNQYAYNRYAEDHLVLLRLKRDIMNNNFERDGDSYKHFLFHLEDPYTPVEIKTETVEEYMAYLEHHDLDDNDIYTSNGKPVDSFLK